MHFTEHLSLKRIQPSVGSVGHAYANALLKCVIGLFKTEAVRATVFHSGPFKTIAEVELATAGWGESQNNARLRSGLGYLTPIAYEQAHYAALTREPQPV